jgi:hypothetical protein
MPATMPRCRSAHESALLYRRSIGAKNRLSLEPFSSLAPFDRIHRADSIGVSVKLTSRDTMIANDIVRPKLFMKRPTMPPMKPTGTKMAISDSVVVSTARPISRVASIAAWKGGCPFSSTNR